MLFYYTKVVETPCAHVCGSHFVCVFPHHPLLDITRVTSGHTVPASSDAPKIGRSIEFQSIPIHTSYD